MLNARDPGCVGNLELTHLEKRIGRSLMSRLCCKCRKHGIILTSGNGIVYMFARDGS
jgi:hypothetical protein